MFVVFRTMVILFSILIGLNHLVSAEDGCKNSKPVVLLHGISIAAWSMDPLKKAIEKKCPGLYVLNVEIGSGFDSSFEELWKQVESFKEAVYTDPKLKDGFNIVAHSQGGVITRTFIEKYNNPSNNFQVDIFITLGSPHRGVYGIPLIDGHKFFHDMLDKDVWVLAYQEFMQRNLSAAEMWNDPNHQKQFREEDIFMPVINNEVDHSNSIDFKENLINLSKFVVFKAKKEDIIQPPDSSWFNFYHEGSTSKIQNYTDTSQYQQDKLGIKTLMDRGAFLYELIDGSHLDYLINPVIFEKIFKHLGLGADKQITIPIQGPISNSTHIESKELLEKKIEDYQRIIDEFENDRDKILDAGRDLPPRKLEAIIDSHLDYISRLKQKKEELEETLENQL